MGLLSILLGLVLAGALADFLVENHIATAAEQSVVVAGTTQQLSMPVLVAIAFGVGALALALVLLGIRRMRRGSRKKLHQRIQNLEDENARLQAEPVHEIPEAPTAPAAPPRASGTSESDETASKW
jgi:hypothetical protein